MGAASAEVALAVAPPSATASLPGAGSAAGTTSRAVRGHRVHSDRGRQRAAKLNGSAPPEETRSI